MEAPRACQSSALQLLQPSCPLPSSVRSKQWLPPCLLSKTTSSSFSSLVPTHLYISCGQLYSVGLSWGWLPLLKADAVPGPVSLIWMSAVFLVSLESSIEPLSSERPLGVGLMVWTCHLSG